MKAYSVDPSNNKALADELEQNVNVCRVKTSQGWRAIDADALAKKWMISPEIARQTLSQTTRCDIWTTSDSTLSRPFPTNERQTCCKRLSQDLFMDTLEASVPSRQQERYAQVFSASNKWAQAFPMKRKGNAPDAYSIVMECYQRW